MQPPMGIIALGVIETVMRSARFAAGVGGRGDEETRCEHVLQLPTRDGAGGSQLGDVEGFVHHVAAPERDDFAGFVEALAGALDAYVSPHDAAERIAYIRDVQLCFL